MATIKELRDKRADAITSYYSGLMTYNEQIDLDGTDAEATKPQAKFKAFNDLIDLHHDSLSELFGYTSASQSYLVSNEGAIGIGEWWSNAKPININASMFYSNYQQMNPDDFYRASCRTEPNMRHPYSLWNQYNTIFGSFDNRGWQNAANKSTYSNTINPFATGSNYRLGEPLEYYGDSSNLLWSKLAHNGRWTYRSTYIGNTSYTTVANTGFNNYTVTSATNALNKLNSGQTTTNVWPSPFERMRYTFWGTGTQGAPITATPANHTVNSPTSGTFTFSSSGVLSNGWWIIYNTSTTSRGWAAYIDNETNLGGPGPYRWDYAGANWPNIVAGDLIGSLDWVKNPTISGAEKTTPPGNGRENVWNSVYSQYYSSSFKAAVDAISSQTTTFITSLDTILSFDYTIINNEAGSDLGKANTQTVRTNFNTWLANWKTLVNDTGSGATYTQNDSKWSNANLASLFTNATSGLNVLITFSGNSYTGAQSGYVASRRTQAYTLLGSYTLGSSESWLPGVTNFIENNTGSLANNSLFYWRHNYISERLNRESGTLPTAYQAYTAYNDKISEISALETKMSPLTTNSKYDITPIGGSASVDYEQQLSLSWDDVKAGTSYDIERKEGTTGGWSIIENNYGYVNPGDPPDFTSSPSSDYTTQAHTKGYQEFGLSFVGPDSATGLSNDFTVYDFNINVDASGVEVINVRGLDCQTYEALKVSIQKEFTDELIEAIIEVVSTDLRITSDKKGASSTIVLTAGTTNDLFTALSTTPDAAVAGTTTLEQGKVYYFRFKTNNGYGVSLGSHGNRDDKDWDSQSEWQIDEYTGDKAIHGEAGAIVWDEPENLIASGIDDNGLTPSDVHVRLEWDTAVNANSYSIYRSTSNVGGYAYIGNTSNTHYEDATGFSGYIYWYKIKAIAGTAHQLYDDSSSLDGPLESALTGAGVRGKILWQTITLTATTDDRDKIELNWNSLPGATGYIVYNSFSEDNLFDPIVNDDATEMIVSSSPYIHKIASRQFFSPTWESTSDGVAPANYTSSQRYYFIVVASDLDGLPTVKQYYITSPAAGVWSIQTIADDIQTAIDNELANVNCEALAMENLAEDTVYKIRFTTKLLGEKASIKVIDGTFGDSLIPLLDGLNAPEPGGGGYPGITFYYRVQAVQVVDGEIVRRSELSNIAEGLRPIT